MFVQQKIGHKKGSDLLQEEVETVSQDYTNLGTKLDGLAPVSDQEKCLALPKTPRNS